MIRKWIKKIVDEVLKEQNHNNTLSVNFEGDGMNDKYLYDFRSNRHFGGNFMPMSGDIDVLPSNEVTAVEVKPKQRIVIKPVDVLHELERKPKAFDLELLDEKIELLKEKEDLITQIYAKREVGAMIERLKNRKKYVEHREFFEKFDNTDDKKIANLLKKYKLVMEISEIFIPDFPKEAIDIMKDYTDYVESITDKKPVFYVIAEKENFKQAYDKRDPILLVQSPFGFFYQILGAWDKELVYLGDL